MPDLTAKVTEKAGDGASPLRLPPACLVVLVGPSGAGKSTWALENFRPEQVVASDDLRALVGESRYDQKAGTDAFDVLDLVVARRARRRLLTVVDTLGLDAARRQLYLGIARKHGLACHVVMFATPARVCRARNKERPRPVPANVMAAQLTSYGEVEKCIYSEGFDAVHAPGPVEVIPEQMIHARALTEKQRSEPVGLGFGLQVGNFTWPGGAAELSGRLSDVAEAAEKAGCKSLFVMDHFVQIPQAGRHFDEMLESYTTLAYLAGRTSTIRLGTLVTGVTYRNIAHLAKIIATLDVLSGGRAICGIGAAWFEREHTAYGWRFPPLSERYEMLEDALQALPMMWGSGSPAFAGRTTRLAEAICYPRPLQAKVPILIGGSGEKRTLALVAQYADACNLFGDADTIAHKVGVLRAHCERLGRDFSSIEVTSLGTVLVAADRRQLTEKVERLRPAQMSPESYLARVNGGTVEDLIGHFRQLADAGVNTAIVNMPDIFDLQSLDDLSEVVRAFA